MDLHASLFFMLHTMSPFHQKNLFLLSSVIAFLKAHGTDIFLLCLGYYCSIMEASTWIFTASIQNELCPSLQLYARMCRLALSHSFPSVPSHSHCGYSYVMVSISEDCFTVDQARRSSLNIYSLWRLWSVFDALNYRESLAFWWKRSYILIVPSTLKFYHSYHFPLLT